jgi:sterol desaturase/sphingolipid hydroxylase (fatty acid hydroxylase superfamily)
MMPQSESGAGAGAIAARRSGLRRGLQVVAGMALILGTLHLHEAGAFGFTTGFLGLAVIFVPAERMLKLNPHKVLRRQWRTDVTHYFVSSAFITLMLAGLTWLALALSLNHLVPDGVHAVVRAQPQWAQLVEAVLLSDLFGYMAHRASHAWPLLWRFHSVHHSIEQMDWLASARFHPVDTVVTHGTALLPVAALGIRNGLGAYALVTGLLSIAVHANVTVRLGVLSWLIANPEFHHWHHANEPEAMNRNFTAALPLIDLIMGTAYLPKGRRPGRYGIDAPVAESYLGQLLHPLRRRPRPAEAEAEAWVAA